MSYIQVKDIKKIYQMGSVEIQAVAGISFTIEQGEFIVILGPSGAGKTTVMNIIGGMDLPSSGSVKIDGKEITSRSDKELTKYRRDDVGFIFQSYNLIPNLTALENVELATHINTDAMDSIEALDLVGIAERAGNFPAQLSGGEQQRVAIARAIAKNPKLLLCDEPTGALDTDTGTQVLRVLRESSDLHGMTVVVITHNKAITTIADRVITIRDGIVDSDEINTNIIKPEDIQW